MSVTVGVDLGGTKVCALLSDTDGAVHHRIWRRHRAHDYATTLRTITTVVSDCLDGAVRQGLRVEGIGVAIAAWLDPPRTRVLEAANLGFTERPLRADLQSRFGLPVRLANDADAAALAEARFGAGARQPLVVLLSLGTGVGGGIVLDGELLTGASGLGGELGHLRVADGAAPCVCGASGCLETVASGSAVARRARELAAAGNGSALAGIAGGSPERMTAEDVVAAARAGAGDARRVLRDAGHFVGIAVAMTVPVLDPSMVVLAGGLAGAARDLVLGPAREVVDARRNLPHLREQLPMRLSTLGADAGALGAAALVHDHLRHPRESV